MPKPFIELTLEQFADLLGQFAFTRRIESVHVHHTWRPNHANFRSAPPLRSIEGMYDFHTRVNGWSDIAQHITIDPRGTIWTGRNWNAAPASSTGFNGNSSAGPFMFETIGDFDKGMDPFDGDQKTAVIGVVANLLERFGLTAGAVKFHNEMSSKTCPGSAIDKVAFLAEVEAAQAAIQAEASATRGPVLAAAAGGTEPVIQAAAASGVRAFGRDVTELRRRSLEIVAQWSAAPRAAIESQGKAEEPSEETMNANDLQVLAGGTSAAAGRGIFGDFAGGFTADEKQILRRHVVDLRLGVFSEGGIFDTSLADVERIFGELLPEELAKRKAEGQPLRLVFFAHGGLVSEESGIRPVLRRLPFWRENGLYPIFFCWETGLKETVVDLLQSLIKGQRGLVTDAVDAGLEFVAGAAGRQVWSQIKRVAELASLQGGGARTVAGLTRDFWNDHNAEMEIHAVGHSAGAIFHSYFLPALFDQKPKNGVPALKVQSLAPAVTTALFESNLMPLIGPGKQILNHTMYTMNKDLEKSDKAGPYNKSLLYFVSRAFETGTLPAPILGLQESLVQDSKLIRFYGLSRTVPGVAKILFSKTADDAPLDSRTQSTTHGDFDNEVNTMNSVGRRILGRPDGSIVSFVDETAVNEVTRSLAMRTTAPVQETVGFSRGVAGAKQALCIGIDGYPSPNTLDGCVNDARNWSATLQSLGFTVTTMLNQDATHSAILAAMRNLIGAAHAGDVVVIQYAGHGTSVPDLNGDEASGQDQALVPVDFDSGKFLIDDEIRAVMGGIPKGVSVTCFMDCCHSGTNTRLFGAVTRPPLPQGVKARFLPVTKEMTEAHIRYRGSIPAETAAPRSAENMTEVNFAACTEIELALESNGSGEFTRRALTILRAGFAGMTNRQFQERVTAAFGPAPPQHPLFDGGTGAGERGLLSPTISVAVGSVAAGAPDRADISSRLDGIEVRLARLGV